jgi:hypothetical protein
MMLVRRRHLLFLSAMALSVAWLSASPARADRACSMPPALTGRTCTEAVCITLQAEVDLWKAAPKVSCNRLAGCGILRAEKAKWLNLYIARNKINAICWGGGDAGHQQAAAQAIEQVGICEARIALPEPIGCSDPCP